MLSRSLWLDALILAVRGLLALRVAQWPGVRSSFRRNAFLFGVTEVKLRV